MFLSKEWLKNGKNHKKGRENFSFPNWPVWMQKEKGTEDLEKPRILSDNPILLLMALTCVPK